MTKTLFVLNSAFMSLERRGGFDSTNWIEILEEQLIVQGLRLQKLEARFLGPVVPGSEGSKNGNDSSDSENNGPDEHPDSEKGKVNLSSRKSRKNSTGRDQDQNRVSNAAEQENVARRPAPPEDEFNEGSENKKGKRRAFQKAKAIITKDSNLYSDCLLYTSPSPRD